MSKIILSLDLSLACPAFAVLKVTDGKVKVIEVSHVKTKAKDSTGQRLFIIANHLQDILDRYEFDAYVMEKGFSKFPVATQQLQRVVGVTLVTLYRNGVINVGELSPTTVKKGITGSGKASKEELATCLHDYVGDVKYKTDDESDAVGVGIAFAKSKGWI
ncbi:crossover junction endodeoxyribonuclease RuvC [Priestia megaterium]|uniref:crossover junction endodeoxyribonuclease RuvC n=1 Tax=Priestia megaterium TaxID=1404 RepID=UPI00285A0CED|nr:crossover junction endodeoxyribonuclease RuvC [Priestia megaterium]MDR7207623.1 crossover junction endodeoxyribonuclease RuvC [Priestia megaterium]